MGTVGAMAVEQGSRPVPVPGGRIGQFSIIVITIIYCLRKERSSSPSHSKNALSADASATESDNNRSRPYRSNNKGILPSRELELRLANEEMMSTKLVGGWRFGNLFQRQGQVTME